MRPAWTGFVVLGLACTGAGSAGDQERAAPPDPPTLRVGGPPALMEGLVPALTSTHQRTRATLEFELRPSPTDEALQALTAGELDLVAAARPASPLEQQRAQARGWDLAVPEARHLMGVEVTAVAVHAGNDVPALTYDQVIGIFCTRTVTDWSDLEGAQTGPLRPLTLPRAASDRVLFEDFFCGPRGIHDEVAELPSSAVAEQLVSDPAAISYVSLSQHGLGRLVPLRAEARGEEVAPSQQNVISGSYPLYRDVYLFTAGPAAGWVRSFVDWVESAAGQEVVDEQRFVPLFLRPARLDGPRPLRETIHFDQGRATPNQRSMARIELLIEELAQRGQDHVILEGFTDDREPDPYALAEQRAATVRDLLAAKLPDVYFELIPRGPKQALAPNDTPYGRLRNRRVQIYLASEEKASAGEVVVESEAEGG